ncbi:hypothetical protein SLH49_02860 [Cognatiyoonia sp. IB215446]|uniref:hypothetical protein n=1 Tax=Cognatiyoonia sp. IB215446 TaxID=3097355 RepID=UPI002A15E762|nr:hypothetical protein [Cognatiyoonia sp. IB215446]MDX8346916.1 hypothetical protein [Cognatiyoonia sp. IB215446]
MKDIITSASQTEVDFNLVSFEIDAFGRYEVTDPEMLDVVAGGFRSGGGNGSCQQTTNGNCGCNTVG